jgi:hypothetical protein
MSANLAYPLEQRSSTSTEHQALSFFVNSILANVRTAHPVTVQAVYSGGLGPIGTVDVLPLVSQVNGIGQGTPHKIIYGCPYLRYQGGTSAVILDPAVGDLGLLICCDRDISNVIATLTAALPGSLRRFNFADGIYVGCAASGITPSQYVQFLAEAGGINVVSPGEIKLTGSSINLNGATVSGAGEIQDALGVVLGTHDHTPGTYVAPSGGGPVVGNSGEPIP